MYMDVQCTIYNVQCTCTYIHMYCICVFTVQCTMYNRYMYNKYIVQRCRKNFESGGFISIFFLFFCQFQKVRGITKSRPIDPFFYVIYLFLIIRFGQKSAQISYFLPSTLLFFTLFHLNFFHDLFFAQPPFFCP